MSEFKAAIVSITSTSEKPAQPGYDVVVQLDGELGLIELRFRSPTKTVTAAMADVRRRLRLFGKEVMEAFQDEGQAL